MPDRVLVTGAAGFIGFHLASELARQDSEVVVFDNFSRGNLDNAYSKLLSLSNVSGVDIDLATDPIPSLNDFDYIYHLAAINGTKNFYESPFSVLRAASLPTIRLLESTANSRRLKKFVVTSSSEVYANSIAIGIGSIPTQESVPLSIEDISHPRWSYAAGKISSEAASFAAATQFGIPITVIRYHNVYGPRMGFDHVIPSLVKKFHEKNFVLHGHDNTRSFIFVDDAVRATLLCGLSEATNGKVVHVGTSDERAITQVAYLILDRMGLSAKLSLEPAPSGSVKRRCPDVSLLNEIGFESQVTLEDGIARVISSFFSDSIERESLP